MMNLMLNALEAIGKDGWVRVELLADQKQVRFRVLDNGPGLPEIAQRLGEAFQTTKPEGVGLGLAVARQVAEGHGGHLLYTRQEDVTCFEFLLPAGDPPPPSHPSAVASNAAAPRDPLRKNLQSHESLMSHILIVDDEESICWALRRLLTESGHRVTVASCAEEAFEHVGATSPHLMMLDIRLPGMDGLEALDRLRRLMPDLPIVIMTAFGSLATAVRRWGMARSTT